MGLPGVENDLGVPESCLVGLAWPGLDVKDRPDSEICKRCSLVLIIYSYTSVQHGLQGKSGPKCSPLQGSIDVVHGLLYQPC